MSSAALPCLNINELNFDTCERLRHLDSLLTQLGLNHGVRVLDVGGYPGYMARAFPHWNVVTADTYAKGHPPYVKASGAALPFPDATYDATIACDVLEHVPLEYRAPFLKELARVSKSAIIVAGPYNTPGAAMGEQVVRTLLPQSSPAQVWLAEHAECGLPSLEETRHALGAAAVDTAALPAGSLTAWMLFFAAQAAGEADHRVAETVTRFIHGYNQIHAAAPLASPAPAYRHAVVAAIDSATAEKLKTLTTDTARNEAATGAVFNSRDNAREIDDYVNNLGELLKLLFTHKSESSISPATSNQPDPLTREYIQRLEAMLSHRGTEINPQLPLTQRISRAWRILRGKTSK